jgi:superfamily II RNA helicase
VITPAGRAFALDPFQVEAIAAIDEGRSVLVSAPTGSGKTVVAEHAVARTLAEGGRAFYTTPIKALSNQKYHDLTRLHGVDQVGLLTGDTSVNGDAPVVVMTTEVLRNMIYSRSSALDGLAWVVLDEVHYLQDSFRGPVWEEVIVHLPEHVQLVCLSATVSNAHDIGDWLATVRGPTDVVVEETRPVELANTYLVGDKTSDRLHLLDTLVDGRPNPEGERFDIDTRGPTRHGGRQQRGRGRPRSPWYTPNRLDVLDVLEDDELLPAIVFIFSRAACDDAVKGCLDAGVRLTTADEREQIRRIAEDHLTSLTDHDLDALDADRWLAGLEAGVAAHHAGHVPPFKEAVEACFVRGLVKVVFATETLALGINMPARTVVIEKLTKFTGERHEFLTPGQYTQLTGRAGRRGIDDHGHAIVLWSPFVTFGEVAGLAASRSFRLTSAFRPTYNMAANLVRRYGADEAHRLLNLSFAQYQADAEVVRVQHRLQRRRADLQRAVENLHGNGLRGAARDRAHRQVDRIERDVAHLEHQVRGRTDTLVDHFDRVLQMLEAWGHLDGWALTRRGEQLVRIYHETDLLVAESLEEGIFDGVDAPTLAGLASGFVYESRQSGPDLEAWFPTRAVAHRAHQLEQLAVEIGRDEAQLGLPVTRTPDWGFFALAHAWAAGDDLVHVLGEDDLSGGDFVRTIRQLLDLLRQLGEAAADPTTAATARAAADLVHRGVVAASSSIATGDDTDDTTAGAGDDETAGAPDRGADGVAEDAGR